jgi:hypothetical protein
MNEQEQNARASQIVLAVGGALVIIGVIVLLFATGVFNTSNTNTATNSQTTPLVERPLPTEPVLPLIELVDSENRFSLQVPAGWTNEPLNDGTGYSLANGDLATADKLLLTSVRVVDFGAAIESNDWSDLINSSRQALNLLGDITIISDQPLASDSLLGHEFEYMLDDADTSLYQLQHIYAQDTLGFILSAQSETVSWPQFANTVQAMYDSFKALN